MFSLAAHPAHAEMPLAVLMYIFVYKGTQWRPGLTEARGRQNVSNFVGIGQTA
jgi:hypothetical protein